MKVTRIPATFRSAHKILLIIPSGENVSVLSQFCGLELRQLTRYLIIRLRGPDALRAPHTFISKCCEGKSMFCFSQWKSKPYRITKDERFVFKPQRWEPPTPANLNPCFRTSLDAICWDELGNDSGLKLKLILASIQVFFKSTFLITQCKISYHLILWKFHLR